MSEPEIIAALSPVFQSFVSDLSAVRWDQYALALADVNPGDLDDALADVRRSHAFRNAPLPADILRGCESARRRRVAAAPPAPEPKIDPNEGELRTHTIKGIGTLKLRVLPDDHPALQRFACYQCKDSGWRELPPREGLQPTVTRCHCWKSNPELQREREQRARFVKEMRER